MSTAFTLPVQIQNGLGALIDDPDNDRVAITLAYHCGKRFNVVKEGCKERTTLMRIFLAVKERDMDDMVRGYEEYSATAKAHMDIAKVA